MQNTNTSTLACSFLQLQQALLSLRQQQEALAEERTPEIEIDEERDEVQGEELERHRREQPQHQHLNHRKKERSKESMYCTCSVIRVILMSTRAHFSDLSLFVLRGWHESAFPNQV